MLANRGAARLACRTLSGFRGASIVCDAPVLRRRRADEQPAAAPGFLPRRELSTGIDNAMGDLPAVVKDNFTGMGQVRSGCFAGCLALRSSISLNGGGGGCAGGVLQQHRVGSADHGRALRRRPLARHLLCDQPALRHSHGTARLRCVSNARQRCRPLRS